LKKLLPLKGWLMPLPDLAIERAVHPIAPNASIPQAKSKRGTFGNLTFRWEIAFISAALLVVCGHLLIKAGLNITASMAVGASVSVRLMQIVQQPLVLLGLGIYGMGTMFWMVAVAQSDLSLIYPLTSLNYILIAVLSAFLFQESISIRRGTGIGIIALGVILLARSQRKQKPKP
jgi:uncharacterized membrane protein